MKLSNRARFTAFFALGGVLVSGCSDDKGTGPGGGGDKDTVVGVWQATNFVVDAMASGMSIRLTLDANGIYTMSVDNDTIQLCGDQSTGKCINTGPYSITGNSFLYDVGEDDQATFSFTVSGSVMT